jgi:hypothetical protein
LQVLTLYYRVRLYSNALTYAIALNSRRQILPNYFLAHLDMWKDVVDAPLAERGWVMQEAVLVSDASGYAL